VDQPRQYGSYQHRIVMSCQHFRVVEGVSGPMLNTLIISKKSEVSTHWFASFIQAETVSLAAEVEQKRARQVASE